MVYCLVTEATSSRWRANYFKTAKIRPYVTVARNYGCKILCNNFCITQNI
jgi:hypothetical protein